MLLIEMQSNVTRQGTGLYAAKPGCDTGNLIHAYRLVAERASGATASTDQEEQMQKRKGGYRSGREDAGEEG